MPYCWWHGGFVYVLKSTRNTRFLSCSCPPQVSDELKFTREDDDDAKVKALEFYFPQGEEVGGVGLRPL